MSLALYFVVAFVTLVLLLAWRRALSAIPAVGLYDAHRAGCGYCDAAIGYTCTDGRRLLTNTQRKLVAPHWLFIGAAVWPVVWLYVEVDKIVAGL